MDKIAVYSGSRNLYPHMVTAAKSLVVNSSVEKIYFLIEDEQFPYELPAMVETIDVSGQRYFNPDGPNMKTQFTYMALMRVCYAKLMPEVHEITEEIMAHAGGKGSAIGTGGMATKLTAAKMVMEAGGDMIIANGRDPAILYDLLDGKAIGTRFIGKK